MKFRKRIQILLLSLSIVSFFTLILFFLVVEDDKNSTIAQDSQSSNPLYFENETVSFYVDSNNNQTKDTGETDCDLCASKQILVEVQSGDNDEIKELQISEDTKLYIDSMSISTLWGYFPDVKLLIPTYTFTSQSDTEQISIPVVEINYELAGENSNIRNIDFRNISSNNYEINFEYKTIMPVLDDFVNSGLPVWFIYYPEVGELDKYYVSLGPIESASGESKNISMTYWHFSEEYSNIDNIDQFKLLIPKI